MFAFFKMLIGMIILSVVFKDIMFDNRVAFIGYSLLLSSWILSSSIEGIGETFSKIKKDMDAVLDEYAKLSKKITDKSEEAEAED